MEEQITCQETKELKTSVRFEKEVIVVEYNKEQLITRLLSNVKELQNKVNEIEKRLDYDMISFIDKRLDENTKLLLKNGEITDDDLV